MKKCELCKKIMTDEEEKAVLHRYDYTYAVDLDFDKICDTCDAHKHAQGCIWAISADMQKFKYIAQRDNILRPVDFLQAKLEGIREYWKKHFTELVDTEHSAYWKGQFDKYTDEQTEYLSEPKVEKKRSVNY